MTATSASGGRAWIAVSVPISLEPIECLLGINVGRYHPILHGVCIMDDGNVALIVDFDLDSAIGVRPMIANLMIFSDNPAEEADSTIVIGINALNAETKKEEKVFVSKGHECTRYPTKGLQRYLLGDKGIQVLNFTHVIPSKRSVGIIRAAGNRFVPIAFVTNQTTLAILIPVAIK